MGLLRHPAGALGSIAKAWENAIAGKLAVCGGFGRERA
jgi:hypothetical protein